MKRFVVLSVFGIFNFIYLWQSKKQQMTGLMFCLFFNIDVEDMLTNFVDTVVCNII